MYRVAQITITSVLRTKCNVKRTKSEKKKRRKEKDRNDDDPHVPVLQRRALCLC